MIEPSPADVGRRVSLPRFNAPPLSGELTKVEMEDILTAAPHVWVLYEGERVAVRTFRDRLEWEGKAG